MTELVEQLEKIAVIPVIVIDEPNDAEPLAAALVDGGLPCAEVTFRTEAAAESIRRMAETHPELLVGAGTVLTIQQVDAAVNAGAKFIVSPGFDADVARHCATRGIACFPGVCTPTEVQAALREDLRVLKFFPAEVAGGPAYVKALAAPFPGLRFIPTGGVTAQNLAAYLSIDAVVACGGSWLAPRDVIRSGELGLVRENAREAAALVRRIRGGSA